MAESGVYTLEQLRTWSKQRANLENSQFLTDDEWDDNINDSLKGLYDLIIQKYGDDYFVDKVSLTTDGQNDTYDLPNGTNYSGATGFYKFLGLDMSVSPNSTDSWVTIRNFAFSDRNRYAVPNFQSFYGVTNLRYRLRGNKLWLTPIPNAGLTLRIWYVPRFIDLESDSDTTDCYGGWDEYVVVDAAIKAKIKQELDYSQLQARKEEMVLRIESVAENRDAANPFRVVDVNWASMFDGNGNGGVGGGGW